MAFSESQYDMALNKYVCQPNKDGNAFKKKLPQGSTPPVSANT